MREKNCGDEKSSPPSELIGDSLDEQKVSIVEAARGLGITRQQLHNLIAGRSGITPEMAVRLGRFCGNGPGLWLRMQQACDLWRAERELGAELERIPVHRTSSAA